MTDHSLYAVISIGSRSLHLHTQDAVNIALMLQGVALVFNVRSCVQRVARDETALTEQPQLGFVHAQALNLIPSCLEEV